MEETQKIVIKNLPLATRNYVVVDTATGKPVEDTTYSLTIAPHVIEKLYELKRVSEEKKQQATLRNQYADASLTAAYTPKDNSVFTPLSSNEYIDVRDVNTPLQNGYEQSYSENISTTRGEIIQSDGILGRVTARTPAQEKVEAVSNEPAKPELDYITADTYTPTGNYEYNAPRDNSTFNPSEANSTYDTGSHNATDNSTFNPTSAESNTEGTPIKIDKNYGKAEEMSDIDDGHNPKGKKERKRKDTYIGLSPEEVKAGRGVAWLAYILFFIPLIFKGNNRYVRIHANQGLSINIAEIIGGLLILPFFLLKNPTGTTEIIVYVAGILGLVILAACALTLIPVMIGAMFGAEFQIPWLLKKRIIRVNRD